MPDTKPCLICGATITRTKQGATDWARRSYCSRTCTGAARRNPAEPELTRACQHCGTVMHRPDGAHRWLARYCSDKCRSARRGPARKPNLPRCEICATALKPRKTPLPWCSRPCKAAWQAAHPDVPTPGRGPQPTSDEDTQPPIRLRSELLPAGTPRKTWIDCTPGHVAVCCGHCRRRFPRRTIRLAERLLTMHRRTCGSGL